MTDIPEWGKIALREHGVKEKPGIGDNARILTYLSLTRITPKLHKDETPWCSAFMCHCIEHAGINSTRSAAARSWADWGIELSEPKKWCIVVLSRGPNPAHGHVGFYMGEDAENPGYILIYGGNQDNQVCTRAYEKSRVISYRWPEVT